MSNSYKTSGTCSREISYDVIDGKVYNVKFLGGCPGNLQGIAKLVEGMPADEVVKRLSGVRCGGKPTSCPDQLAKALSQK